MTPKPDYVTLKLRVIRGMDKEIEKIWHTMELKSKNAAINKLLQIGIEQFRNGDSKDSDVIEQ